MTTTQKRTKSVPYEQELYKDLRADHEEAVEYLNASLEDPNEPELRREEQEVDRNLVGVLRDEDAEQDREDTADDPADLRLGQPLLLRRRRRSARFVFLHVKDSRTSQRVLIQSP